MKKFTVFIVDTIIGVVFAALLSVAAYMGKASPELIQAVTLIYIFVVALGGVYCGTNILQDFAFNWGPLKKEQKANE